VPASGNNAAVTNRISSVQDFNNGLTTNGSINGTVTYFGHSGWVPINGQLHPALFVGQQAGANTNVTDLNVNLLSNAQLEPNTTITLNGCHAGYGGPYSIAEQIALQLKRKVYAYTVGMFFSANPNSKYPGTPLPDHTPIYMLPSGGAKISEFPAGGIH